MKCCPIRNVCCIAKGIVNEIENVDAYSEMVIVSSFILLSVLCCAFQDRCIFHHHELWGCLYLFNRNTEINVSNSEVAFLVSVFFKLFI